MTAAVLSCGALAAEIRAIARRRRWRVDLYPVPALLHNRPERIAPVLERELEALCQRYEHVAVACPFCTVMLDDGVQSTGTDMRVVDVATLLAESLDAQAG